MDYSRLIESIVDALLEVEVLPDSVIAKNASGGWEKREVNPGEVSPLAKSGIRSPRVNMGMSTPTTTFLPFAGLSPAVKEVRSRTGDEDVRVVPGAAESSAVLLKTSPKAKGTPLKAAYAKKTPQQFTDEVGRSHLIILGPASKMKDGLETQKAVFGHEAGHILNKDTTRFNSVKMHDLDIPDKEILDREEGAWKTGNALLKDMGMSFDPHMEKAALHTYYADLDPAKADITNLNSDEATTLLHVLKQPESYSKDTFRVGSKTFFGPDHFMKERFKKVMESLDEVTLPKILRDPSLTRMGQIVGTPDTPGLARIKSRASKAWDTAVTQALDSGTSLKSDKINALSTMSVFANELDSARSGDYSQALANANENQAIDRAKRKQ